MNIKNSGKIYTSLRVLVGLIFVVNSPVGTFIPLESLGMGGQAYELLKTMWDSGYLMHTVKLIELAVGIALLTNRFVPLALILIAPVMVNILLLDIFLEPIGLILGLPLTAMLAYLAVANLDYYQPLFQSKTAGHEERAVMTSWETM